MRMKYIIFSLMLPMLTTGCSSTSTIQQSSTNEAVNSEEPSKLDSYNETMHGFNKGAYEYVLNPIGNGLEFVTPDFIEEAIFSIFDNLSVPNTALNNALQGKFSSAGHDLARFGVNTTVGLLGIFDWASLMGIENNEEDFGQTLAHYGVASGPYVVLPLLGGATPRAMTGMVASFDPINMTNKNTKDLADNLSYASMVLDWSGEEGYPTLEEQKKRFLAMRECSVHDGSDAVKDSCKLVCDVMMDELKQDYLSTENEQERAEMREMAPNFAPSFCDINFDSFEQSESLTTTEEKR